MTISMSWLPWYQIWCKFNVCFQWNQVKFELLLRYSNRSLHSQELSYLSHIRKNFDLSQLWCHCCIIAFGQQTRTCLFVHIQRRYHSFHICIRCVLHVDSAVLPKIYDSGLDQAWIRCVPAWVGLWFRLQFLATKCAGRCVWQLCVCVCVCN